MNSQIIAIIVALAAPALAAGFGWSAHIGHKGFARIIFGILLSLVIVAGVAAVLIGVAFAGCVLVSMKG
jgi:hypothetical protein